MFNSTNSQSKIYALLIGIDCYLPNQLSDGSSYKNLSGCVRDINFVEAFLKNRFTEVQIFKLTASRIENSYQPQEPPEQLPTYENIVTKFQQITELAQPQDHVYIHYSGHGGRATTIYPKLKGHYGFDEAIVPTNIGDSEARYLRDLELAQLIQNMVDKKLLVTVVLDSCHSGGATRGEVKETNIRGLSRNTVDTTSKSQESLVPLTDELIQSWQGLRQQNTRSLTATSGWLPEPKGYVLLAACRETEYAYEYAFENQESNGALTYWLLDSLQKLGNEATYKILHDRILAKVNAQFAQQTPVLQGEGSRIVFSGQSMSSQPVVIVKKVDLAKQQVLLQAGHVHGLRKGAEFAIYQLGTIDFTDISKRVALAKIIEVRADDSWATIMPIVGQEKSVTRDNKGTTRTEFPTTSNPTRSGFSRSPSPSPQDTLRLYTPGVPSNEQTQNSGERMIEEGASAVLLSPGVKLIRKVRLLPAQENQQPSGVDIKAALQAVKIAKAIVQGNNWIEFLSSDEPSDEPVSYQVSINEQGEYEILDAGGQPFMNLQPALKVGKSMAAMSVVKRLIHLSKYHATLQLDNNDQRSPLTGKLKVELCQAGENQELKPLNAPGNILILKADEEVILHIRNASSQVLNITVLEMKPDWSIKQLYPIGAGAFETLAPGGEERIPVRISFSENYTESTTVLKVFATIGATNFHWLELPALDQFSQGIQTTRANSLPQDPLEELLSAVASEQPPDRNLNTAAYPSRQWTTEQLTVISHSNPT
ncbi:MAG: caspase family protein [Scytonema sp. PMC 1069.18]|nr:caspase family protein [Scytonema sp. PMC 1069.18]MEC4886539.1 caspase family protein [Scytonema sp. PMC 1070.18]